jgi:hypothetical protein
VRERKERKRGKGKEREQKERATEGRRFVPYNSTALDKAEHAHGLIVDEN